MEESFLLPSHRRVAWASVLACPCLRMRTGNEVPLPMPPRMDAHGQRSTVAHATHNAASVSARFTLSYELRTDVGFWFQKYSLQNGAGPLAKASRRVSAAALWALMRPRSA